jgi:hypothetical protein
MSDGRNRNDRLSLSDRRRAIFRGLDSQRGLCLRISVLENRRLQNKHKLGTRRLPGLYGTGVFSVRTKTTCRMSAISALSVEMLPCTSMPVWAILD